MQAGNGESPSHAEIAPRQRAAHTDAAWAVADIAVAVAVCLAADAMSLVGVRNRHVVAIHLVALALAAWRARRVISGNRSRAVAATMVALSLGVTALALYSRGGLDVYDLASSLPPILAGWIVFFWLAPLRTPGPASVAAPITSPARRSMWAILALSFAALTLAHLLAVGRHAVIGDEAMYVLQSHWLAMPDFSWRIDEALEPFFTLRHTARVDGRMFTQYPPGWPAVLALFRAVGLQWWSGVLLGVATVWLTYLLGRQLAGQRTAVLAALLVAINPWMLRTTAGYMAHPLTTLCGLAAVLLLLRAETTSARARALLGIAAGISLGVAFAARPLTGLALGVMVALWTVTRSASSLRGRFIVLAWVFVGGLGPLALVLYYNSVTTGHPLEFSYQAAQGSLHDIGFGRRGFIEFGPDLRPVEIAAQFTPFGALRNLGLYLATMAQTFVPVGLLLPLLFVGYLDRVRYQWRHVLPLLVLPLVYSFYWFREARLISEVLPFVLIGVAAILVRTTVAHPRFGRALFALAVAGSVVMNIPWAGPSTGIPTPWRASPYVHDRRIFVLFGAVEGLRREHGRLLVFVQEADQAEQRLFTPGFYRLFMLNDRGFDSDVLVARDLGAANETLIQRFPDRVAVRIVWHDGRVPTNRRVVVTRLDEPQVR